MDGAFAAAPVEPQPSMEEQWQKNVVLKSQNESALPVMLMFQGKMAGPPEDQLLF